MRQQLLFAGIVLATDQLETLLKPQFPRLYQLIRVPVDDLLARRASDSAFRIMTERDAAWWLHTQIVEYANEVFAGDPVIKPQRRGNQFYLRWADKFVIIPKKVVLPSAGG